MNRKRIVIILLVFPVLIFFMQESIFARSVYEKYSDIYDSSDDDDAEAVAVDSEDNIIVTGSVDNGTDIDCYTIKYDSKLDIIKSVTYDKGENEYGAGVTVDSDDNIIVLLAQSNGADYDYRIVKYDSKLKVISSAKYDTGNGEWAQDITVDSQDNIIATGYVMDGNNNFLTIKYSPSLVVISSAVFDNGRHDEPNGVTTDSQDSVIVCGRTQIAVDDYDYFTIKYNSSLDTVLSSTTYDAGSSDLGFDAAVDDDDNIIVTGQIYDGSSGQIFTIKYSSNLVAISSAGYGGDYSDKGSGVKTDSDNNIIVSGFYGEDNALRRPCVLKYSPDLSELIVIKKYEELLGVSDSTNIVDIAIDSADNMILAAPLYNDFNNDFLTVMYSNSVYINSVTPENGPAGETINDMVISGYNFTKDATVSFSGEGIRVNSVTKKSSKKLRVKITIDVDAELGDRDITVKNPGEDSYTAKDAFEVATYLKTGEVRVFGGPNGYVNPEKNETAVIKYKPIGSGRVEVKVYNLQGQMIWEDSEATAGQPGSIEWDCSNTGGDTVSSNIYIIYVKAPGIDVIKRVPVVR
ncbi:hypothetical protein ACFLUV_03705 [Elusimicrobiota bacterium]